QGQGRGRGRGQQRGEGGGEGGSEGEGQGQGRGRGRGQQRGEGGGEGGSEGEGQGQGRGRGRGQQRGEGDSEDLNNLIDNINNSLSEIFGEYSEILKLPESIEIEHDLEEEDAEIKYQEVKINYEEWLRELGDLTRTYRNTELSENQRGQRIVSGLPELINIVNSVYKERIYSSFLPAVLNVLFKRLKDIGLDMENDLQNITPKKKTEEPEILDVDRNANLTVARNVDRILGGKAITPISKLEMGEEVYADVVKMTLIGLDSSGSMHGYLNEALNNDGLQNFMQKISSVFSENSNEFLALASNIINSYSSRRRDQTSELFVELRRKAIDQLGSEIQRASGEFLNNIYSAFISATWGEIYSVAQFFPYLIAISNAAEIDCNSTLCSDVYKDKSGITVSLHERLGKDISKSYLPAIRKAMGFLCGGNLPAFYVGFYYGLVARLAMHRIILARYKEKNTVQNIDFAFSVLHITDLYYDQNPSFYKGFITAVTATDPKSYIENEFVNQGDALEDLFRRSFTHFISLVDGGYTTGVNVEEFYKYKLEFCPKEMVFKYKDKNKDQLLAKIRIALKNFSIFAFYSLEYDELINKHVESASNDILNRNNFAMLHLNSIAAEKNEILIKRFLNSEFADILLSKFVVYGVSSQLMVDLLIAYLVFVHSKIYDKIKSNIGSNDLNNLDMNTVISILRDIEDYLNRLLSDPVNIDIISDFIETFYYEYIKSISLTGTEFYDYLDQNLFYNDVKASMEKLIKDIYKVRIGGGPSYSELEEGGGLSMGIKTIIV
ncbi:MAG: hypothetical protein QW255_05370, partial [Candidatus Bilamarchaeaceae archaeon]